MSGYTVYVDTASAATTTSNNLSLSTSSHYYTGWCDHGTSHYQYYYPYIYSPPITVYKYQIKCPSCKTFNWLELDVITPCTKCKSSLKAVAKSVDYEIEVNT